MGSWLGLEKRFPRTEAAHHAVEQSRREKNLPGRQPVFELWDAGVDKQDGSQYVVDKEAFTAISWWWRVRKMLFLHTITTPPASFKDLDMDQLDGHIAASGSNKTLFCNVSGGTREIAADIGRVSLFYSGFKFISNDVRKRGAAAG